MEDLGIADPGNRAAALEFAKFIADMQAGLPDELQQDITGKFINSDSSRENEPR